MSLPTGGVLINSKEVLEQAQLKEGMVVADFGCGATGHFIFPASKLVGSSGKVYAVDIQKSVLEAISGRIKMEGAINVMPVWGDMEREKGLKIAEKSVDVVLLINNLFLVKDKTTMGREVLRVLKSGGKLVIVDWKPTDAPFGPPPAMRVPKEDAQIAMQTIGFRFVKEFENGPYHYGLIFEKP